MTGLFLGIALVIIVLGVIAGVNAINSKGTDS